jgi:hypothetical protein
MTTAKKRKSTSASSSQPSKKHKSSHTSQGTQRAHTSKSSKSKTIHKSSSSKQKSKSHTTPNNTKISTNTRSSQSSPTNTPSSTTMGTHRASTSKKKSSSSSSNSSHSSPPSSPTGGRKAKNLAKLILAQQALERDDPITTQVKLQSKAEHIDKKTALWRAFSHDDICDWIEDYGDRASHFKHHIKNSSRNVLIAALAEQDLIETPDKKGMDKLMRRLGDFSRRSMQIQADKNKKQKVEIVESDASSTEEEEEDEDEESNEEEEDKEIEEEEEEKKESAVDHCKFCPGTEYAYLDEHDTCNHCCRVASLKKDHPFNAKAYLSSNACKINSSSTSSRVALSDEQKAMLALSSPHISTPQFNNSTSSSTGADVIASLTSSSKFKNARDKEEQFHMHLCARAQPGNPRYKVGNKVDVKSAIQHLSERIGGTRYAQTSAALIVLIQLGGLTNVADALPRTIHEIEALNRAQTLTKAHQFAQIGLELDSISPISRSIKRVDEVVTAFLSTILPALIERPLAILDWAELILSIRSIAANQSEERALEFLNSALISRASSGRIGQASVPDMVAYDMPTTYSHKPTLSSRSAGTHSADNNQQSSSSSSTSRRSRSNTKNSRSSGSNRQPPAPQPAASPVKRESAPQSARTRQPTWDLTDPATVNPAICRNWNSKDGGCKFGDSCIREHGKCFWRNCPNPTGHKADDCPNKRTKSS